MYQVLQPTVDGQGWVIIQSEIDLDNAQQLVETLRSQGIKHAYIRKLS